jgi:tetratricopeptide (TPR) repeat protein
VDNLFLRRLAVAALLLGFIGIVTHGRTVENGYVLDAVHTVQLNPDVRPETSLGEILSSPYWDPEVHPGRGLYRPLSVLSFQLTRRFWSEPVVSVDHFLDLVLHVSCSLAVLIFLMQMGAQFGPALTLATLFLLHPIQVEAATSLVGRSDLLATLFALLALSLSLARGISIFWTWTGVFVLFLMSLLAKESAPGLILLLPACFAFRESRLGVERARIVRRASGLTVCMALAAGCYLILRQESLGGLLVKEMPIFDQAISGFFELRWRALAFVSVYAQKLTWPLPLQPDYITGVVPAKGFGLHMRAVIGAALIMASVAWPAWAWIRRRSFTRAHLGILLFWIAVAPVSNLVVQIGSPFAERFLYFPLIFLLLATVDLPFWRAISSRSQMLVPKAWPAWVLAAIVFGLMSADRVPDWRNNRSLFLAAATDCPDNYISQFTYGSILIREGRPEDRARAGQAFVEAARILPDAYTPRVALGVVANLQGDELEARMRFEEAYARVAQVTDSEHQTAALNLSRAYRALGEFQRMESLMVPLSEEHPEWDQLQAELADYWLGQNRIGDALIVFERGLKRNPEEKRIWQHVIWAHLKMGQDQLAAERLASAPPGTLTFLFEAQLKREGLSLPELPEAPR